MSAPHSPLSPPRYRPDIDGLRAVAVLAVVGFHAFPGWVRGGFVGVDVFFVISGYLITTLILENIEGGHFSFGEFYARRIRRLFPALLLVLTLVYALGWVILLPDEFAQLGKQIVGGAAFAANFVLWSETGYFDHVAEVKPLLHLWSLGIEEQFYLAWPLLLWFLVRRRRGLITALLVILAASFALNVAGVASHPAASFYSPLSRFWELLVGAVLAARSEEPGLAVSPGQANALSLLGLALLAGGLVGIDRTSAFPGWLALLPVVGAVLVMAAGPAAWFNRRVLSCRLLVGVGLISYPLYLWHWPLLSFARILEGGTPERPVRIALVALAVLLAWLSYRFVERPLRSGGPSRVRIVVLVTLMTLVGGVGAVTYLADGIPGREAARVNPMIGHSGEDGGDQGQSVPGCGIADAATAGLFEVCEHDRRSPIRYALLGDSKASALYPGLVRSSDARGRWLFVGGSGPNGAPVPLLSEDPQLANFQRLTELAVDAVASRPDVETVVLVTAVRALFQLEAPQRPGDAATYDHHYLRKLAAGQGYDRALAGLDRVVQRLIAAGKQVVLVVDNPPLPDPRDCVARKTSLPAVNALLGLDGRQTLAADCVLPLAVFREQGAAYTRLLAELQQRYPDQVAVFDPTPILCDEQHALCSPTRDGRLLYRYTDHVSDYAAGLVGARLNAFLAKGGR